MAGYFHTLITDRERYDIAKVVKTAMSSYCHVVNRINHASEAIGKDGRFQIFICIGVRLVAYIQLSHSSHLLIPDMKFCLYAVIWFELPVRGL